MSFDEAIEQAQLLYVSGALGVPLPDLNHGDRVRITVADGAPAAAILDYNFGKYQLLLLPGSRVEMVSGAERTRLKPRPTSDMEFTLCSYNLMGMGSGSAQHPDPADYDHELRRRVVAIADLACRLHGDWAAKKLVNRVTLSCWRRCLPTSMACLIWRRRCLARRATILNSR